MDMKMILWAVEDAMIVDLSHAGLQDEETAE